MAEEELETFLAVRFPGKEPLIKRCVAKLADEGFSSLADLKALSLKDARELGVPFAFAARLSDEGYFKPSSPSSTSRRLTLRPRRFFSGDAIDLDKHYHCRWPDFDTLVNDIDEGQWLLLTGPWQSGKTSLLTALGLELQKRGYLVVLTTLDDTMVAQGNNAGKQEVEAAGHFYSRLIHKVCLAAGGELKRPENDAAAVTDVFRVPVDEEKFRNVIWLVDEAQLLNYIHHQSGYAVHNLLSGLREAKRECVSRNRLGTYRLHSFCLCGLPQLTALIGDARVRRIAEAKSNVPSSPQKVHDPLRPHLSGWSSPLSKQVHRDVWRLNEQQIAGMIMEYARDRSMFFKLTMDGERVEEQHEQAVSAISRDIYERTAGHAGLVGSCCNFLQTIDLERGTEVWSLEHWLQSARRGRLRSFIFSDKAYGKMVRVVAGYPDRVKSVILACIDSPDGCSDVDVFDKVLEAIADGVLEMHGTLRVGFTSPLLLATLLESCKFAPMQPMPASIDSLVEVYEVAISLMNPEIFLSPKGLNASGQPSEYIMQSQFFRALMFVMEQGLYKLHKYHVFVEVKERDEKRRMDGYMENAQAPKQGIEIEVGSTEEAGKTVKDHLKRSVYYKKLHGCEMDYMYFWVGEDDDARGAKGVMQELQQSILGVNCWYVRFSRDKMAWTIQRLKDDGKWVTTNKAVAPQFPSFLLSSLNAGKRQGF